MYLELRNKVANSERINFLQPAHAPTAVGSALLFGFLPAGRQVRKFILSLLAETIRFAST
ncbi:MAG: hypothetical protein AAB514_00640 [Patescibacteria group bacterium]